MILATNFVLCGLVVAAYYIGLRRGAYKAYAKVKQVLDDIVKKQENK